MSKCISMTVFPSEILESGVDVVTYVLADLMTYPDLTFNSAVVEREVKYCYVELFFESDVFSMKRLYVSFYFDSSDPSILANVFCDIDTLMHEIDA